MKVVTKLQQLTLVRIKFSSIAIFSTLELNARFYLMMIQGLNFHELS